MLLSRSTTIVLTFPEVLFETKLQSWLASAGGKNLPVVLASIIDPDDPSVLKTSAPELIFDPPKPTASHLSAGPTKVNLVLLVTELISKSMVKPVVSSIAPLVPAPCEKAVIEAIRKKESTVFFMVVIFELRVLIVRFYLTFLHSQLQFYLYYL